MSDSALLRVGIAGHGIVGRRRHAIVDTHPALRVVAVSDVTYCDEFVNRDGVKHLRSWERLFDTPMDALLVCLPNNLAAQVTREGLERGLHVFCEKPPGRTVEEIREVRVVEARHPGLKLKYGFNHRYHDSVLEAKSIVEAGEFGPVINVRGVYGKSSIISFAGGWRSERSQAGGGILLDQGIHMLDMIRYLCGDFDEIKSFISNGYWHHDVEDNAYALMRNSVTGVVAMLHSTATQWRHKFRLEITLRDALLELSGILSGSKSYGEETLTVVRRKDGSSVGSATETTVSYLDDHSWKDEITEFAALILNDEPVRNGTSADAERVMELVFKIYNADHQWNSQLATP